MFPTRQFIVLVMICGTAVCHVKNITSTERLQRQNQYRNVNGRASQRQHLTLNKSESDVIRSIFKVNDFGLEVYNTTQRIESRTNHQHNEPSRDAQDFEVQRQSDGKLNIVYNEASLSQKSIVSRSSQSGSSGNISHPSDNKRNKDIYFPDELHSRFNCEHGGKSFCTEVADYPEAELEQIIKNQISKYDFFFGENDIAQPVNINPRMGPGEESLCANFERVIYPKAGESKDLKWLYIVNHQNYTQAVRIEECVNPEESCKFAGSFPNGYETKCKQSFIYRQLVAFTKSGELIKDVFKFPSCCKCVVKHV